MAIDQKPHIALLGGGYTLQKVAERLSSGSFVITSRSAEVCAAWRARGWASYQLSVEDRSGVEQFFKHYPSLRALVDSVPPLRSGAPEAGVENVVSGLPHSKIEKVVYLSTTGVFGRRDGAEVTEETPAMPWNSQGTARLVCENAYRKYGSERPGFQFTALRLPAIYGPDRGVVSSLRAGTYRLVDNGLLWTNRIHVEDLAAIIARCLEVSDLPETLCVSDDCPALAKEVVSFVCEREGLPYPPSISSDDAIRHGAYTMVSNQRIKNDLLKRVLGITLRYPSYREGLFS